MIFKYFFRRNSCTFLVAINPAVSCDKLESPVWSAFNYHHYFFLQYSLVWMKAIIFFLPKNVLSYFLKIVDIVDRKRGATIWIMSNNKIFEQFSSFSFLLFILLAVCKEERRRCLKHQNFGEFCFYSNVSLIR